MIFTFKPCLVNNNNVLTLENVFMKRNLCVIRNLNLGFDKTASPNNLQSNSGLKKIENKKSEIFNNQDNTVVIIFIFHSHTHVYETFEYFTVNVLDILQNSDIMQNSVFNFLNVYTGCWWKLKLVFVQIFSQMLKTFTILQLSKIQTYRDLITSNTFMVVFIMSWAEWFKLATFRENLLSSWGD